MRGRFPPPWTRAGIIAALFVDLWWAVELTFSDTHKRIPALAFVEELGGSEVAFDALMWVVFTITLVAFYRGTRGWIIAMGFANLTMWTFIGFQFWLTTTTHFIPALCWGIALGGFLRIMEATARNE